MNGAIILETPRLRLREMNRSDLDFVATMIGHPEVMRYYPKVYDRSEAEAWIERNLNRYAEYGHGLWLVELRATGEPVGQVGIIPQTVDGVQETEVGYLIHRPYWRKGFAAEAARACRDHAFRVLGRERIISLIRPENLPSQGVARSIGSRHWKLALHHQFVHFVFVQFRSAWA